MGIKNLAAFFTSLCLAVRQAGVVAKSFQGKVENEGKDLDIVNPDETEFLRAQRTAKTLIDEVVQEIILLTAQQFFQPGEITIDAEEKTPLVSFFSENADANTHTTTRTKNSNDLSLVIDPIDGTLEYLQGNDSFSVCVGLVEKGKMRLALVFFPARDVAYAVAPDGNSYIYPYFGMEGVARATEIILPKTAEKIVYQSSKVPTEIIQYVEQQGYMVINDADIATPDEILTIITGKSSAYLSHHHQIRDILVGAVVGNAKGGFMNDWNGNKLYWPNTKRLENAMFGNVVCEKDLHTLEVGRK